MIEGRYRIAEAAQRTGFSPPTLRYYEDIGLLPPAEPTPAGYRVYYDRALERLTFIARAKQLGCTLEEIANLAEAWNSNECGPRQAPPAPVVTAKLADRSPHRRTHQLRRRPRTTAAVLESTPPDGPCDDTCGCVRGPSCPVTGSLTDKGPTR